MNDAPRHHQLLVIGMASLLVAPPVWQAGQELVRMGDVYAIDLLRTVPTAGALRGFEAGLEERSWLVRWTRQSYGALVDRVFQRGNRLVVFGEDGWLFHRESVDFVTGPDFSRQRARRVFGMPNQPVDPLTTVVDFHRQLGAMGIELVVVPVPVKATLYPEQLWPMVPPASLPNNPGLGGFLAGLGRSGIPVVDVTRVLLDLKSNGTAVFLPRDTHWTPEAMRGAAHRVTERVRRLPAYAALSYQPSEFDHRATVFEGQGDVTGMLDYATREEPYEPMSFQLQQVIATSDGRVPTGDSDSPILLIGDSLTNVFSSDELQMGRRGGFAEHIANDLGMSIDVIASPGGGATRGRQSLALRPAGLANTRIVIWEFTQRDLLFSGDGWATVELSFGDGSPDKDDARTNLATRARLVSVTDTSDAPAYADCLMIAKYEYLDGDRPGDGDEFFVAYWGWRDWARTAEASYQSGDIHSLSLSRAAGAITLENTCWVDSVGLSERPWWVN